MALTLRYERRFKHLNDMNLDDLTLQQCFEQLGMADYNYIQLSSQMEALEEQRQLLLKKIEGLIQNGNANDLDK